MAEVKEAVQKKEERLSWDEALEKEAWISPMINIYETDDNFHLEAFMPGVDKDNIKIKYEDGSLVIMGRINFNEVVDRKYILREMEVGNYYRRLNLSDTIDDTKIEASFENGVLSLVLPKHERVKPKVIKID